MSAPPIARSGRRNYLHRDRAKCHQDFSKSHRVTTRSLPFFFPSHQLPLSINSAHRLSSAISLQTISLRRRGLELLQGSRLRTAQRGLHANEESRTTGGTWASCGDSIGHWLNFRKESEQNRKKQNKRSQTKNEACRTFLNLWCNI